MSSPFNIQRKIVAGLLLPTVCFAVLAGFAYSNLLLIEKRIGVLGKIEKVELAIMELRRQGKFFLFSGGEDYYQASVEIEGNSEVLLKEIKVELLFSEQQAMVDALISRLDTYKESLAKVRSSLSGSNRETLALKSEAHAWSMALEEQTIALSGAVRERIVHISAGLRRQLLAVLLAVSALSVLGVVFIRRQVLFPLKDIEQTTKQIGEGNFTPVELRKSDDEIRALQKAFNSMVAELKSRQEQLVQSQKLASIGTLSAGIAHQVNNALNNISLAAQYLSGKSAQNGGIPETSLKALRNIDKETARARDIVRSLLDFSRQSELAIRRVSLKQVVDNAMRFVSAQTPSGVLVSSEVPEDVVLDLDPQRVSEALLNIIMNGIEAIGDKKGVVRIFLSEEAPQGSALLIIEDSGCGIAEEDLARVFDPFFTRKDVGRGTGLGLSVTYGIIEECRGTVRVASQLGAGTRFCITFPVPEGAGPGRGGARQGRMLDG